MKRPSRLFIVVCGLVSVVALATIVAVFPLVVQFGYRNDRFSAFVRIARKHEGVVVGENSWSRSIDVVDLSRSEMSQNEIKELLLIGEGITIRQLVLPAGYNTSARGRAAQND